MENKNDTRFLKIGTNKNYVLKRIYLEMENKNDTRFLKIGTNKNYVHFLIQSVPRLNVVQIIKTVKV
ncbi:hypothetical protein DXA09_19155 [Absiella sp. AM54-8XD]|nr:hypothetical protein DXA09_19155 [Absiella sp. AM54-8XD]